MLWDKPQKLGTRRLHTATFIKVASTCHFDAELSTWLHGKKEIDDDPRAVQEWRETKQLGIHNPMQETGPDEWVVTTNGDFNMLILPKSTKLS